MDLPSYRVGKARDDVVATAISVQPSKIPRETGLTVNFWKRDFPSGIFPAEGASTPAKGRKSRGSAPPTVAYAYFSLGPMCACGCFEGDEKKGMRMFGIDDVVRAVVEMPEVREVQLVWFWAEPGEARPPESLTIDQLLARNRKLGLYDNTVYTVLKADSTDRRRPSNEPTGVR